MGNKAQQLPALQLRATFQPSTVNREKRTVDVTWTTGARVLRGFWEKFWEELSLDPKHVRMGRFQSGRAPFLIDHASYSVENVRGVVQSARLGKGEGTATVRFPKLGISPDADRLFELVADGITPNVSVGYRIHKMEKVEEGSDKIPVYRAVDWEPIELSGVAIGADGDAAFRASEAMTGTNTVEIVTRGHAPQKDKRMDPENQTQQTPDEIRAAERERISAIQKLARLDAARSLPEGFITGLIERGTPLETARANIIDKLAELSDNDGTSQAPSGNVERGFTSYSVSGQRGAMDDFRAAAVDSLLMRAGVNVKKPHAAAADLRHTSSVELARTCLSRSGTRVGSLSPMEVVKRAMTTSDFPAILTDAVHVSLRNGFESEPASHRLWVPSETVPDFREQHRPILGSAPNLAPVEELGEYQLGSFNEDSTSYRVEKFGRAIAFSWELVVNDRLGAWLKTQPALGQAARRLEATLIYSLFKENSGAGPTMQDGIPLFNAAHKNLAAPSALNAAGLGAARLLMRRQTALEGGHLGLTPRFLVVSPEQETDAEILLASTTRTIAAGTESDPQAWIRNLQLVVESRLDGSAFYVACGAEQVDTIVLARLEENAEGPVIEEEREFIRDAMRMKVRHVAGAKVLDWRGLVKVPKQ
ncbi:hypothetical protein F0U61_32490 [Archangium violaceum]|uniref:prohead protease/major capsid protein fusion protein n=1 Tax=Archangium violaceum TaxID=83451 RepID=UPI002B2F8B77|nr:hypothetical protein F0U61_32490 [Archangium violaceum]